MMKRSIGALLGSILCCHGPRPANAEPLAPLVSGWEQFFTTEWRVSERRQRDMARKSHTTRLTGLLRSAAVAARRRLPRERVRVRLAANRVDTDPVRIEHWPEKGRLPLR